MAEASRNAACLPLLSPGVHHHPCGHGGHHVNWCGGSLIPRPCGNKATALASEQGPCGNKATALASEQGPCGNKATALASEQGPCGNKATALASEQGSHWLGGKSVCYSAPSGWW